MIRKLNRVERHNQNGQVSALLLPIQGHSSASHVGVRKGGQPTPAVHLFTADSCRQPTLPDHVDRGSCIGDFVHGAVCSLTCVRGYEFPDGRDTATVKCGPEDEWRHLTACVPRECVRLSATLSTANAPP